MESTDDLWQRLIEEECARWSARLAHELVDLPQFSEHQISDGANEVKYSLWHESPEDQSDSQPHSFVLQAIRKSGLMFHKNYLAGFSLDENSAVVPIADDVLAHYD